MARVYRLSDRIGIAVDDIKVTIAPLSLHNKALIEQEASKGTAEGLVNAAKYSVKYGVKNVDGLEDADGQPYKLKFTEDGGIEDECLDDLFNIASSGKLSSMCLNLINGIPDSFYDPLTGKKLEGVEFITSEEKSQRKKNKATSGK